MLQVRLVVVCASNIPFTSDPTLTQWNLYAAREILHNWEDPFFECPDDVMIFDFEYLGVDEDTEDFSLDDWAEKKPYLTWEEVVCIFTSEEQAQAVRRKYIEGEWLAILLWFI